MATRSRALSRVTANEASTGVTNDAPRNVVGPPPPPMENYQHHHHLLSLPPEVAVLILERLEGAAVARVPQVCRAWRDVFTRGAGAAYEDSLACALRARYGVCVPSKGAGGVYMRLRGESCHLCPQSTVMPFVYAASVALGPLPTLFPVCASCAQKQLSCKEFDVLVEAQYAELLALKVGRSCDGALYSNPRRPIACARLLAVPGEGEDAQVRN